MLAISLPMSASGMMAVRTIPPRTSWTTPREVRRVETAVGAETASSMTPSLSNPDRGPW